jgi:hypothetical protein
VSQQHERNLKIEEVEALERLMPSNDLLPQRLRVNSHYGSIEEAEEKRFPWLRRRRARRRR